MNLPFMYRKTSACWQPVYSGAFYYLSAAGS